MAVLTVQSPASAVVTLTPILMPAPVLTGVRGDTKTTLTIAAVPLAQSYNLLFRPTPVNGQAASAWQPVPNCTGVAAGSYDHTGLTNGQSYDYQAYANFLAVG